MFNPHIHQQQQQQQQQQFQQHLRQLQQLFQQQPPPPPPPQPSPGHHVPHHHHQAQRALSVPPQPAPNHRMVNMCQANQAAMMGPNAMLQGALLMQQMQGNMRGFGMGGQQFRQFFSGSSLLGPVPMMGFPAARPYHQHARYYNNTPATANTASSSSFSSSSASITTTEAAAARHPDRKRDSDQMAAGSADDQPAASSTNEASDNTETDGAVGGLDEPTQSSDEQLEEPVVKKLRTEGLEDSNEQCAVETVIIAETDGDVLSSECNGNSEDSQPDDCILLEEGGSVGRSDVLEELKDSGAAEEHSCVSPSGRLSEDDQQVTLPPEEAPQVKDEPLASPDIQEEGDEGVTEGASKFYCYLCSITCHNQQNFKSHMNSVSHQQRMMEIQHMSNACLVTLLPRVQETLQGANKDGEKKEDTKHWCATCHTHFTSNLTDHRHTEEHKLASRTAISTCSVCKKRFRTTQIFVEHLQSQEHRQKVEKQLQENEGSEALGNPAAMDTDGFSLEEVEEEEEEERQGNEGDQNFSEKQVQDGCSSLKEVTLKNMASDEQYDPTTVYGSSFFAPVAGFLCRLCNKFYHFESSALHTHCKSLEHFENLKRYRESLSQKDEAVESSREPPLAADSLRPAVTGTSTDCSEENSLCDEPSSAKDLNFKQPVVALERLDMPAEDQRQEEGAEPEDPSSQDLFTTSATSTDQDLSPHSKQKETTSEAVAEDANDEKEGEKEAPALQRLDMPAEDQRQEEEAVPEDPRSQDLFTTSATSTNGTNQEEQEETTSEAVAEDANDEKEGEKEAPAVVPGKKSRTGKAKPKRRSGRAANRR